ncbi:MAG: hypothetical protein JO307_05195 [Bryobacterales bacterium]|nr:hypothetical protein [Bryobacterales bacterium]MBV9400203.1 hypothetical protein [Bryobacterales bacterium]
MIKPSVLYCALAFSALAFGAPHVIKLTAPKGANAGGLSTRVAAGPDWVKNLRSYKAQNHLSSALNQQMVKEKSSVGGAFFSPNYANGAVDTLPYFNSWFVTGSRNSVYTYSMLGHSPKLGGTTVINNRILPLAIFLNDGKGNNLYEYDPTGAFDINGNIVGPACGPGTDVNRTVLSPLWNSATYPGNGSTLPPDTGLLTDTKQRAEFTGVRTANWHTPLGPPQNGACSQIFAAVSLDPTAWAYLADSQGNIVGEAMDINVISAVFETYLGSDLSIFGTPNSVFPMILTDNITAYIPGPGGGCCVLGYHTAEQGKANPAGIQVWAWATYLPPGNIFEPWEDVLPLSHEVDETYNDPFINTSVAPWVDGSVSFEQGDLETGDAIEAMNNSDVIYPVPVNGYLYHIQNTATLQWFTRNPLGPANGPGPGVYSWPNTNTLNNGHNPLGAVYGEGSAGFFYGPPF